MTAQHEAFLDTMGPFEERLIQEIIAACKRAERHGEYHVVLTVRQGEALLEFFRWFGWNDMDVSISSDNRIIPSDWMVEGPDIIEGEDGE